jgi:hypothetical protein
MAQTEYNIVPEIGINGQQADNTPSSIKAAIAEGEVAFGHCVQVGTSDGQYKEIPALPAADGDAITTTPLASATSEQVFSGVGDFDGDVGVSYITPARTLTFLLNAHADWLATQMRVVYRDVHGVTQVELLDIPVGGDVTLKTLRAASQIVSLTVPVQDGTNGTITVGVDNTLVELDRVNFPGVVLYRPAAPVDSSVTLDLADESVFDVMYEGTVWVTTEADTSQGDYVYVRVVEDGTDLRGQFSNAASSDFALLPGATYLTSASADGLAKLAL